MATPGQLVETMAHVLGVPVATVSQYDRQLAEAGLRTSTGRGTSAATVTATDAANLLIAILGSPISGASIKAASQTCETLGALPVRKPISTRKFGKFGFDSLAVLPRTHNFRDAVSALIGGVGNGEPFKKFRNPLRFRDFSFDLNVDSPALSAGLLYSLGPSWPLMASLTYGLGYKSASERTEFKPDLEQRRRVTFRTIDSLATLIKAEEQLL
jgi:hypothetical protein